MSVEKYYNQIEVLNSTLWEGRALKPKITEWLDNFDSDQEKDYALYLLSRLMYFSSYNIRTLLRSLYRDSYRYPIIKKIRQDNKDTLDPLLIESEFAEQMSRTRFLGVGNPSESGVHLLYYFRQENKISKSLFVNTDDVIKRHTDGTISLREEFESADRFVFIDDLCGSGEQAITDTNVRRCVDDIKKLRDEFNKKPNNANEVKVVPLKTCAKWYGMTYKEDKPVLKKTIADMEEKGLYDGI